ncbi:Aldehyde dehydrogenase, cytosolic [Lachnellula willkommii]|uniref:aldehyde dehydrogenase (NAD(+)) n=1 Tax=Lachnellula willkommii TaxID=215461 RepID=A0A559MGY7_9HELO|nr:Aldehyde dehydrogenase, cytosolic [Lachnellula willkommii]
MASRSFLQQIEGKFVAPLSQRTSSIFNPKNNSLVTNKHPLCGQEDIDLAVETARAAFRGPWSSFSGAERGDCLYRLADLVDRNAEEAAYWESVCSGRVVSQLSHEVPWIARVIRYYAGWCDKLEGESLTDDDGFFKIVKHEPLGVCTGITPWNGPLMVLALKAAPALATGNTFILKPPEKSPLSSLYAGSLFEKAGFPAGVFNIITGDGTAGAMLANHMGINKVSFTGSVPTGKKIQDAATHSNMKRVTLELGGKSPALVFADADLEKAIAALSQGFTQNAGQVCVSSSRVYAHESIADKLIDGIKARVEEIGATIGSDPQSMSTIFGPVVDRDQYERVHQFIEEGKASAELVTGGYHYAGEGSYIPPTIFKITDPEASVYKKEIFGPVLSVRTFKTEDEVIEMANDTEFGLAAYVFTEDISRVFRVTKHLQAGSVGVNAGVALFPNAPFGGFKSSGVGKELGKYALDHYTNTKTIYVR